MDVIAVMGSAKTPRWALILSMAVLVIVGMSVVLTP